MMLLPESGQNMPQRVFNKIDKSTVFPVLRVRIIIILGIPLRGLLSAPTLGFGLN